MYTFVSKYLHHKTISLDIPTHEQNVNEFDHKQFEKCTLYGSPCKFRIYHWSINTEYGLDNEWTECI